MHNRVTEASGCTIVRSGDQVDGRSLVNPEASGIGVVIDGCEGPRVRIVDAFCKAIRGMAC